MSQEKAVKAPNYSEADVALLVRTAAEKGSLNGDTAATLASEIGKSKRSIIAKIKQLELPYTAAVRKVKGTRPVTKDTLVNQIADAINSDPAILKGLQRATAASLQHLLDQVSENAKAES